MNESIRKCAKVGLVHFMAWPQTMKGEGPILETLHKIACDDYFDAVEVSWIKNRQVRKEAARLLDTAGLTVCYGAQPRLLTTGLNPNDLNEDGRFAAQQTLIEAIDEAKELGASGIAFLAGKWEPERREEHFSQLLKTTRALCAYAGERGMKVELEVFDYDLDKKSLIGPAPYAARFAAKMRACCPNFGLLVDLSHLPQTYESAQFAIRTMRPYITHLHIGNAVVEPGAEAFGDTHPRFGFPKSANGLPELTGFLRVCLEEGLLGMEEPLVLSFEVKPWKDEDSEVVLANAKRMLNRAWALV